MDNNGDIKTQLPQFEKKTIILEFEKKGPFFRSPKNMFSEIKNDLSFGDTELGLILTFGYLVSSIVMSTFGGTADRRGPKQVLRYGVAIAAIAAFLTGVLGDTFILLLLFIGLNQT